MTKNASGTVTGTTYTKEPEPGDQVSLTIDLDLQAAAEQSLTRGIENMKSKSTETSDAVGGGALVAVDVATGQPLAIANYPTFDLQTLFQSQESYDAVKDAENEPLFNRALLGQYSPGSTFKPCTAIAGLTEGVITTGTRIQCTGTFRKYEDTGYAPSAGSPRPARRTAMTMSPRPSATRATSSSTPSVTVCRSTRSRAMPRPSVSASTPASSCRRAPARWPRRP